ncbi:MAG: HAD-IC family P-type ATPase [Sterolibacteriaceae bacterium MAG5]|nr:HAD-IC family P-type ATPase [Candidatus Nitricoxidireducens bremensis]
MPSQTSATDHNTNPVPPWHALAAAEALAHHGVDAAAGLAPAEAAARLAKHGPNQLTVTPGRSALQRFLSQLIQPLVLVLIASGVVTALLGEWVDASVIFGVVAVNAVVGYIQEGKAAAALAALARAVATEVTVLRGGRRLRLDAAELVPGDVVWLAAGDKVPADLRLVKGKELRTIEAALTGESAPVAKHVEPMPADTSLADRANMAYAGTAVVAGQATGVVVATGDATETGRISRLIAAAPDLATPLTRKMEKFSRQLLVIILALAALTFAVGIWRGESAFAMFMAAVALAVGAIPEGLPAAITITLAIGVGRMAKRRAIVRQLPAVEALGSTTVICSDKTGTLTENEMTVCEVWAGGRRHEVTGSGYAPEGDIAHDGKPVAGSGALRETLVAGALCNDAGLHREGGRWQITGDPTEAALLTAARKAGLDETTLQQVFPRRDEIPFDSARQTMATLHEVEGRPMAYAKGAPEKLLAACSAMLDAAGHEVALAREATVVAAAAMAQRGLRVLALARKDIAADGLAAGDLDGDLVFLGLVGMIDPPRRQAVAAVRACHGAGIRVKMITGDHADTAIAIARRIGIVGPAGTALTGRELAALGDDALAAAARDVDVFARVEPEQKLRLVRALQANGELVAMTGDGVNDAPALKQADIGIAMGITGTEVAKEAAAMVLTDDNFATIEAAVEEGRGIYDNLVKFITWTLPTNFGEGLVILAAIVAGVTLPITPLQILWINMTTAVLLGLTLAFEPTERGIMRRRPRPPAMPILDRVLVQRVLLVGLLLLVGSFGLFQLSLARGMGDAEARTVAANVFVFGELFYLFNCRSLTRPVWAMPPLSNPWIWWGVATMAALQLLFTYLPAMNRLFGTAPIGLQAWGEILAFGVALMVVMDLEKLLRQHR